MKGELKPEAMAELKQGKTEKQEGRTEGGAVGNMEDHHRFMIQAHVSHIATMEDILTT